MKYIVAMIQPHRLPDVKQALFDEEVYSMTVSSAAGYFDLGIKNKRLITQEHYRRGEGKDG